MNFENRKATKVGRETAAHPDAADEDEKVRAMI